MIFSEECDCNIREFSEEWEPLILIVGVIRLRRSRSDCYSSCKVRSMHVIVAEGETKRTCDLRASCSNIEHEIGANESIEGFR